MSDGAITRRPHLLGVFPKIPRPKSQLASLPILGPRLKFTRRQSDGEDSVLSVESDHVAVAQERDWSANSSLRSDMTDTEAARCTGEAAIGDQGHLATHALAIQSRGGRQHFAHARTAFGALVSDDEHVAFAIRLVFHRLEARLFAIEATRRPGELQIRHPGDLHDRASRGQI